MSKGCESKPVKKVENARVYGQILVNSFFSRESVLRAYGLEATVYYLGIDTTAFVNNKRPREPFLVGLGSMTPEKNARGIIEAVSRLYEPRPPLVWVANAATTSRIEGRWRSSPDR